MTVDVARVTSYQPCGLLASSYHLAVSLLLLFPSPSERWEICREIVGELTFLNDISTSEELRDVHVKLGMSPQHGCPLSHGTDLLVYRSGCFSG